MSPREVILELSHNCNLSCIMCGFTKERNRPEYFMKPETLDRVFSAFETPPEVVRLNGRGESTIHPKFEEILERIRQAWPTTKLHIFTNLTHPRTERYELLKTAGAQVFISLDSPDAEELNTIRRGAKWPIIERNLAIFNDQEPRPFFVFTLQEPNLHRIRDIAELAAIHRVGLIYNVIRSDLPNHRLLNHVITQLPKLRKAFTEAKALLETKGLQCLVPDQIQGVDIGIERPQPTNGRRSECPALRNETCIQFDGHISPCNMFHPAILGHVNDGRIDEILSGEKATEFRATHKTSNYCKNCAWMGGAA